MLPLQFSRTLILFLFLSLTSAVVIPLEYYYNQSKFFPTDTFDTENSTEFHQAAFGSLQFSITTWFQLSRSLNTDESSTMLHLTALDVKDPWDDAEYPTSVNHLANLVRVEYNASDTFIHLHLGSFTNPDQDIPNGDPIEENCWHFLYVGVDYEAGVASFGIFNSFCQTQELWNSGINLGGTFANEALDNRLTFYTGGSKSYVQSTNSQLDAWAGSMFRTTFLVNYYTDNEAEARTLMLGERKNMYFMFLDNTVQQNIIYSYNDTNTYLALGNVDEEAIPTTNGVGGLTFAPATDDTGVLTLATELEEFNFISFWVKVNQNDAITSSTIMSVLTPSGQEFLSVLFVQSLTADPVAGTDPYQALVLRVDGTLVPPRTQITFGAWHFVFLTFTYHGIEPYININLMIDTTSVFSNFPVSTAPPDDYVDPLTILYFGKILADTSLDGSLRNVIGGTGTYFLPNDVANNCSLSIGLQDPYCLLCNSTVDTPLFTNPDGTCQGECPDGTYQDADTLFCVPCDSTCETCTGPGPASCLSCSEDIPLLFKASCFVTCPTGSRKVEEGLCDCDPATQCSGCTYNPITMVSECITCEDSSLYLLPDKSRCVPPLSCPLGTIGNPATGNCETSCPTGTVANFASGMCEASCPADTYTRTNTQGDTECYSVCPDGTYQAANRQCVSCPANCASCLDATTCLSCIAPALYHEGINTCEDACQDGFIFEVSNYYCKACTVNCTVCASNLFLYPAQNNSCVEECPIGTQNDAAGVCVAIDGVDAQITNKTYDGEVIYASQKENIILVAEYNSSANIVSYQWKLDDAQKSLEDDFFKGADRNDSILVIQTNNLDPDVTYTVIFEVTDSENRTAQDSIYVTAASAIPEGKFVVSPANGTAYDTEFQFEIADFPTDSGYKFDIITYSERYHYVMLNEGTEFNKLTEPVLTLSVLDAGDQGNYTFVFPPSDVSRIVIVELRVYNDIQETVIKRNFTLMKSADLPLQKVLVWLTDTTTMTDIDKMLEFVRAISLYYARSWESKLINEYLRGELLLENLLIRKNLVSCSRVVECSGSGTCDLSGNSFTCGCEVGVGGFNCYYGERDFERITQRIKGILTNLYLTDLDRTNVEKAILILDQLTTTMDFMDRNDIFFFRDIINKILKVQDLKRYHLRYVFSIIGEVIEYVKRPLTGTWFKDIDKSYLLRNFTSMAESSFQRIDGIRSPDTYFIADTNFLKVLILDDLASNFQGIAPTYAYDIEWEHFGFTFPRELLNPLSRISIKMLGFKDNPYTEVLTSAQITNAMLLEIYEANGTVKVQNLTQPVLVKIPKITATPIFEALPQLSPYTCQYKRATDAFADPFLTEGCQFVEETNVYVVCSCNHLTGFAAQLNVANLASIPTAGELMEATNEWLEGEIVRETIKRTFDLNNTAPVDNTTVIAPKPAPFIREYRFPNAGFYVSIAIFALFLISKLLNMGNIKKNSLKRFLEKGQSVLVVTYHPILTLFITAHTAISNTQNMRLTKFFYMISSYMACTSLFYYLLDLDLTLGSGAKVIASAILSLIFSALPVYLLETLYQLYIKKRRNGKRKLGLYHGIHIFFMFVFFGVTIGFVGLIREQYEGSWVGCFFITMLFDLMVLDFIVLLIAMLKNNDSRLLYLSRKKGFYVDTGKGSIITQEDIEELLRRAKGILGNGDGIELGEGAGNGEGGNGREGGEDDPNNQTGDESEQARRLRELIARNRRLQAGGPSDHYANYLRRKKLKEQAMADGRPAWRP